jgi:predicted transcriptional regulator
MRFPPWVRLAKGPQKQAEARLQYLIHMAALQTAKGGSLSVFAKLVGVDRTLIYKYIKRGTFSLPTAMKISAYVGEHVLPHNALTEPLSIEADQQ